MVVGGIVSDRPGYFVCRSFCFHLQRIELSFLTVDSVPWLESGVSHSEAETEFSSRFFTFRSFLGSGFQN